MPTCQGGFEFANEEIDSVETRRALIAFVRGLGCLAIWQQPAKMTFHHGMAATLLKHPFCWKLLIGARKQE